MPSDFGLRILAARCISSRKGSRGKELRQPFAGPLVFGTLFSIYFWPLPAIGSHLKQRLWSEGQSGLAARADARGVTNR